MQHKEIKIFFKYQCEYNDIHLKIKFQMIVQYFYSVYRLNYTYLLILS